MRDSSTHHHTCVVSFRCSATLKAQMETFACLHRFSLSDLIRYSLVLFMKQQAEQLFTHLPVEDERENLAVISRMEPPIKRESAIHHHIAFLNREEHNYHGFRFAISRRKHTFQRYFSPNDYGSAAAALAAAIIVRDYVLEQLELSPDKLQQIYSYATLMEQPSSHLAVKLAFQQ